MRVSILETKTFFLVPIPSQGQEYPTTTSAKEAHEAVSSTKAATVEKSGATQPIKTQKEEDNSVLDEIKKQKLMAYEEYARRYTFFHAASYVVTRSSRLM